MEMDSLMCDSGIVMFTGLQVSKCVLIYRDRDVNWCGIISFFEITRLH